MTTPRLSYGSLTTPDFSHDESNFLTELLLVVNNYTPGEFPWRGKYKMFWGKNLSVIKKLQKDPFEISPEQICWYIVNRAPQEISSKEFAKLAYSCRKLFRFLPLENARVSLLQKIEDNRKIIQIPSAPIKKKQTLEEFLKGLENG